MAREAWVALAFFPLAVLGTWLGAPAVMLAAAILAMAFLVSQAMILKEAKGIPAWRTWAIVPLIIVTGLAEGAGLLLAAVAPWPSLWTLAASTALAVAALTALRAWTWHSYVTALENAGAPQRALEALDAFRPWFFSLGLLLPGGLIGAGLLLPRTAGALFALAGLAIFAAGGALKFILVRRAGYNQGFALTHTPVRGQGRPGPAIKPGWSALNLPSP
jgi:phenylacetyl-CoA:acceptor oxidoreductase subunit 2